MLPSIQPGCGHAGVAEAGRRRYDDAMRATLALLAVLPLTNGCADAPRHPPLDQQESLAAIARARPIANRVFRVDCSTGDQYRFLTSLDASDRLVVDIIRKVDGLSVHVVLDRRSITRIASDVRSGKGLLEPIAPTNA